MKITIIRFALLAGIAVGEINRVKSRSGTISIQSIDTHPSPVIPLAEIQYDPSTLDAEFTSYDAPELSGESKFVRIGIYDSDTKSWKSSTSISSANSFNKGYAQTMLLSLDGHGNVVGVSCKSAKIDAGHTRDFGPKVKVMRIVEGKTPELSHPIIASKDGTMEGEVPEKTFFQKYWWVLAGGMVLLLATGGGDK